MGLRRIFTGPTPIVDPLDPTHCFLPWKHDTLVNVCGGMRLWVDVVEATFDFHPFENGGLALTPSYGDPSPGVTFPPPPHDCFKGLRTGVTFEGPYLSYEPLRQAHADGSARGAGQYEPTDNGVGRFLFDLACKRPIYLPYDGTVEIWSQYPGTWEINFLTFLDESTPQHAPIDSEVPLTMVVANENGEVVPKSVRQVKTLPPGAHSYTYRDTNTAAGVFPSITHNLETAAKTSGGPISTLSTIIQLADFNNLSGAFYTRWGVANTKGVILNGAGSGSQGLCTWHVSLF